MKIKLAIINTIMFLTLFVISMIHENSYDAINIINLFIHGIKVMFIINCIVILKDFKLKKFTAGCLFIATAWLWNFLNTLFEFNNPILELIFYNLLSFIGFVLVIYGVLKALSSNRDLIEELKSLAFFDSITNLPNKNSILSSCPIKGGVNCQKADCVCKDRNAVLLDNKDSVVLYIDIDDFKDINDNLGSFYGDLLLEQVAKRLKSCIRNDDILTRISGDEFLIIMTDKDIFKNVEKIVTRILNKMKDSYNLLNKDVLVSCSIGVAKYPIDGSNLEDVLQKANIAISKAKKINKSNYIIYDIGLEKESNNKFDTINDLKQSIKNKDFVIYYQSKANTFNNEITGLEALVRWNHPKRGIVYPNDFIQIAEDVGLIKEIDINVLNLACRQIESWINEGKQPYNISVNISPVFFNDALFVETLDQILSNYKIDCSFISIEITENIVLKDVSKTKDTLQKLKSRNIKVYMDDFGKGYSSLSYIKEFPIDYVKIDKAFIDGITQNHVDLTLVETIVNISKQLGFKVVSEGVESEEQLAVLKRIGCHEFQGYVLCKPQPIEKLVLL
jgi:diguanylate cyclase